MCNILHRETYGELHSGYSPHYSPSAKEWLTKEKDCYVLKMYNKYNIMREIAYGSDQPHPLHDSVEEPLLHLKANENQQTG